MWDYADYAGARDLQCVLSVVTVGLSYLPKVPAAAAVSHQLSVSQCFTGRRWKGDWERRKKENLSSTNQKSKQCCQATSISTKKSVSLPHLGHIQHFQCQAH